MSENIGGELMRESHKSPTTENNWYEGKATLSREEIENAIFVYVDEDKDLPFDINRSSNDSLVDFGWLFGIPDDRWKTMPVIVQILCLMKSGNSVEDIINWQIKDNLKVMNRANLHVALDTFFNIGYIGGKDYKKIKKGSASKHRL